MLVVYCNVPPPKFEAEMRWLGSRAWFPVIIGIALRFFQSQPSHLEPLWASVGDGVRQPVESLLTEKPNYSEINAVISVMYYLLGIWLQLSLEPKLAFCGHGSSDRRHGATETSNLVIWRVSHRRVYQLLHKNIIADTDIMFVSTSSLAVRCCSHVVGTFPVLVAENYQLVNH